MGFPFVNRGHVAFKRMREWLQSLDSQQSLTDGILFIDPLHSERKVKRFIARHCGANQQ
jgi:hypothetical protein